MKRLLKICMVIILTAVTIQTTFAGAPIYRDPVFYSVDDLITWIETEDAENFQEGRFRNCLLSIRERGEVIIPTFSSPNVTFEAFEVLAPRASRGELRHEGYMLIFAIYSTPTGQIIARTRGMNPALTEVYERVGVSGYFTATPSGARQENFQILERTILVGDAITDTTEERHISYVFVDNLDTSGVAFAVFILDKFFLGVTYYDTQTGKWFNELVWERTPLSTAATPERPPSDGRPPAGGAPGGAVGGGEAGTGTPTAP
ncbi:MAG: hypothetical protein FWB75_08195, partial [Oscillospiraceae bacterium]|nr:hypothetical protein [Oscillospiraceae bacterium]